ncbi:MAG: tol-pal system protein YbgF [bacterium]
MSIIRPLTIGVTGLLLITVAPFLFAASNPVAVESLDVGTGDSELPYQSPIEEQESPAGYSASEESSAGETHYQLQILQQEVQELRGLVEDLKHTLARMQVTQEDRYLELDSRFQQLSEQLPALGRSEQDQAAEGNTTDNASDDPTLIGSDIKVATQDEKALYETALELIRSRQYDLAITQLQAVIEQYPDGSLAPNAYYWLGEVYAAKPEPDYESARKALAQVLTFFPEHRKVPDAAFKLGKVYYLMGDCDRATELLSQVVEQHQGKSVSKLAESYLRDNVGSCE